MKYPSQFIIKNTLQPKRKWGLPSNRLNLENNLIKENPRLILLINSEGFGPFFADTVYTIRKIQNKIEIVDINNGKIRDGINIIQTKPAKLGNHNYLFLFSFNEGGKDFTSIFDKMLSTFRFTK